MTCEHENWKGLRPGQGGKTPHYIRWCMDCGAVMTWDPKRCDDRYGWVMSTNDPVAENLGNVLASTKEHAEDLMELAGRAAMKLHEAHAGELALCEDPICKDAARLCCIRPESDFEEDEDGGG